MKNTIPAAKLKEWVSNFKENEHIPFITTSALIELDELKSFIADIEKEQVKNKNIRIYFVRFSLNDLPTKTAMVGDRPARGCMWLEAGKDSGLTQGSIVMVPVRNFNSDEEWVFSADDIVHNDKITIFMPGKDFLGTGLFPP